ncbi:MAG: Trigger factor [Desulfovibrio sp.]
MQYTVEDLSPVKKKITVTVPAEEVDAVLDRTTAHYRARVALPGFRKGKAPLAMVEKRFSQDIYGEAVNEVVNGNLGEVFKDLDIEPLGNLSFDENETPLARGKEFKYAFSFEHSPKITIPKYENIGVEEDAVTVEDKEIDEVIDRVRRGMAERVDVEEARLAEDNDVVIMDFEGFDENGEPVEGVSGKNFQVSIGDGQVIPDFEALAKTVKPGESGSGKVVFPEDYPHAPLAGKAVTMNIAVHSLKTRKLPEVDEEFAKKAGGFDTVEAMRENIRDTYTRNRKDMAKAKAQSLLLEKLLEKTEFPLPEGMIDRYAENIMHGRLEEMARGGQDIASFSEEDFNKMKDECKEEAVKYVKTQLFLLAIAKKEDVEASPQEMTLALRQIAQRGGHDIKEVQEHYARNNLYPALRDRIMADKAMDVIYDKASGNVAKEEIEEKKEAKPKKTAKKTAPQEGESE